MIRFQCPQCAKLLAVKDELAGRSGVCPACKAKIQVPVPVPTLEAIDDLPEVIPIGPMPVAVGAAAAAGFREGFQQQPPARRRAAADWDDDEEDWPETRRSRRPDRESSGPLARALNIIVPIVAIALPVIALPITALAVIVAEEIIILLLVLCGLAILGGNIWFLIVAFRDDVKQGLLCLIPFYFIYYLFNHFQETKRPFYLSITGFGTIMLSFCIGSIAVNLMPSSGPVGPSPKMAGPAPFPPRPGQQPPLPKIQPPPPPNDQGSAEPGLRARWSFDEGAGNKTRDSGPHKLEANLHNVAWVDGVRGKALQFNGADSYVELGADPALSFAENAPLTITGWVKTANPKGVILSFRHHPDIPRFDLLNIFLKDGKLIGWVRQRGNAFPPPSATSLNPINDNNWHHFAVTRTDTGEVSLYIDGNLNARLTSTSKLPSRRPQAGKIVTNVRTLGIEALVVAAGPSPVVESSRLSGCIDELHIYGEVLSEDAIRKLSQLP